MRPGMSFGSSSLSSSAVAIVGLGFFFTAIALLFIIAYRHAQHASAATPATSQDQQEVEEMGKKIRPVFVPIPGVLDGGAPLPASVMLVAPRADRPTVREMVTPPASPAEVPAIPDESSETAQDIAQQPTQKTQALPILPRFEIIFNPRGERLVMFRPDPHESLPHFWQN